MVRQPLRRLRRQRTLTIPISPTATPLPNRQQIIIPRPLRPPRRRRQRLINIQRQWLLILRILIRVSILLSPPYRPVCPPLWRMYRLSRLAWVIYRHRRRSVADRTTVVVFMMTSCVAHRLVVSSCLVVGFCGPSLLRWWVDPARVICSRLVAIHYVLIEMHLCS